MAEFFDVQKNHNTDVFKKVFSKTLPMLLAKFNFGKLLDNETTKKFALIVLHVYFEERKCSPQQFNKDIDTIFQNPAELENFKELLINFKTKAITKIKFDTSDLRVSTKLRTSLLGF